MKIGITGASGFLGSAIVAEAVRKKWKVVAFSRRANAKVKGASEVRVFGGTSPIDLSDLDVVINLAGDPIVGLWTTEKKRRIRESRLDLTSEIVEAISHISRSRRPSVLVSASAIGYYGDRGDEVLDDESDVGFGYLSEVCRDWESASQKASRMGVRVVNPRIGIVLGAGGFLDRLRPIFRLGMGGKLGSGDQWMSWIHRTDLAKLFVKCVTETSIHGPVNCVSPAPVTNRDFAETYAEVLKRKAVIPVPTFFLKALPGGMSELFLSSQRVDPATMKAINFDWAYPNLADALSEIEN